MTTCPNCKTKSNASFCENCGGRMPPESTEIASPLAAIIKKAMESKPKGPVAEQRLKMEARMKGASDEILLVVDRSGSMGDPIGNCSIRKIDHMESALRDILKHYPRVRVIMFDYECVQWNPKDPIPGPRGGTDLAGALKYARKWKPKKTIIISDGYPDNQDAALEEAQKITGEVDTIYCGPDADPAIDFLRSLAHSTGGTSLNWDGYRTELASNIRGLLT